MKVKFCGAAREVTGSSHLLTLEDGFTILLDCGLYQGGDPEMGHFNRQWLFDPGAIDCVVLSHAHIDHIGKLPFLVQSGFSGPVHATHATRSLATIMLLDSAKIQQRDSEYRGRKKEPFEDIPFETPLYSVDDVHATMELFVSYPYERWFRIHPTVEVLFRDAGHILGSASVTLRIQEGQRTVLLGFTGDIGRPARPILRNPQPMPEVDYLICESTYGDREHLSAPEETGHLLEIIGETCLEKKGKLIIPAFGVGRTQEIVYLLDQAENLGSLPRIPVYVDSPLAVNATTIYGAHPECFDEDLTEYLLTDENPFGFNGLHYIRDVEISKQLNLSKEPAIIISASGMANAGRVKHHIYHTVDDPRNTILIVGYCAPGTLGRMLRDGAKNVRIFGKNKEVRARIEIMDSFSAHGDKLEMLDFIHNQRKSTKKVFLVHGDYEAQKNFRGLLLQAGFQSVDIPELGQEIVL
jgi:metallo-beta-lactamase family protein